MTHTIDVDEYAQMPLVQAMHDLELMAATWPIDVRNEVIETLGSIAIICATRGAREHTAAAEFLSVARRLIREAGEHADRVRRHGETGGN